MASPAEDRHPPILLRDDSWLSFNARVLEEAMDPAVPLLERAKFLSIFTINIESFKCMLIKQLYQLMYFFSTNHFNFFTLP